jgi:trans-aconitate methyltransferase
MEQDTKEKRVDEYKEETYGERIAEIYDDLYANYDEAAIRVLKELAGGGKALELGIGTGRIALPLQAQGVEVHGVDASPAMVARLRAKPGGAQIPVTFGNFAEVAVEGRFSLIYVLFNTFYALLTQEEQVQCFQKAAEHLEPEGVFVIEAFMPDLARFQGRQALRTVSLEENQAQIDASLHDPLRQQISSQHILLSEQGVRLYPVKLRYVWPSEFVLMARLAGMRLKDRWGSWTKEPFTAESGKHISVYEKGE